LDVALFLPLLLIAFALVLYWLMQRKRDQLQMPAGITIYQDMQEQRGKILYSQKYRLKGRPDFLLRQNGEIIPVEAKTGRTPSKPYWGHLMQLVAYCILVEENYGIRPTHGVIRYPDQQFEVEFTPQLETTLTSIVAEMRRKREFDTVNRSHNNARICGSCGFLARCDQHLDTQQSLNFRS
jgi:CRISPR-associated exonuclease Cas4